MTAREDSSSPDSMKSLSCKTIGFCLRFGRWRRWKVRKKEGGGTGGNPSVRCGGQLPLRRGAETTPQSRCGVTAPFFAPKRPFGTFRCCAWLIFRFRTDPPSVRRCSARLIRQAETLELQLHSQPPSKRTALSPLKRSCFRFAALTLRVQGSQRTAQRMLKE